MKAIIFAAAFSAFAWYAVSGTAETVQGRGAAIEAAINAAQ